MLLIGTHGIRDIIVDNASHAVSSEYFEHSTAIGALYIINKDGFSRYLSQDRNASNHYELPGDLAPGLYRVFAYDIESDGTLHNGVGYPASTEQLTITESIRGS